MDFIGLYRLSRFITEGALVEGTATASGLSRQFISSGRSIDIGTGLLFIVGFAPYIVSGRWRAAITVLAYRWVHMA